MAINRPVTKTLISTTAWGIPVTDQVNANTTDIAALKPTAWTNLPLVNGWTVSGATVPQYRKIGDNVQLRGSVGGGVPSGIIANLPVGFRPFQEHWLSTMMFTGGAWQTAAIIIPNTGAMQYHTNSPVNPTYVAINTFFSTIA